MSYQAIVAAIHTRPHPNADRLQLGTACGNQVVVGMDVKDGELGVFFGPDGELSHEFCVANNLYNAAARAELGLPETDKPGFFAANRRVRSQNFRGVKSDGFWVPLSYFDYLGPNRSSRAVLEGTASYLGLYAGYQFDTLNGQRICEKYYTPATKRAMANGTHKARKENAMFPKHSDTAQFRFLTSIPQDSVVYITEKLHGTSARYGRVLEDQPLARWKCIVNNLTMEHLGRIFFLPRREWVYLNGSRNVILEQAAGPGFYGTNEFRYDVVRGLELHKGEILYGEIVGFVNGETPIMPTQDTTKLKDKALEQQYGKRMAYSYGCQLGEHKLYIYKIMKLDEDGNGYELSMHQMIQRCQELGLQTVPVLAMAAYHSMEELQPQVERLMTGPSVLDSRHIREGVVLRIESATGTEHVKAKSFEFGFLEGYIKDQTEYVDTEEVS